MLLDAEPDLLVDAPEPDEPEPPVEVFEPPAGAEFEVPLALELDPVEGPVEEVELVGELSEEVLLVDAFELDFPLLLESRESFR